MSRVASRIAALVSTLGLALFVGAATWLAQVRAHEPAHARAWLDDGTPLTLHLPRGPHDDEALRTPARDVEDRPPVVVLMHGFASDRVTLSGLVWRLAAAGYAVVSFDAPGHGANRNPFRRGRARPDAFADVFGRVVDFARQSPFVDGSRIAVGGHSMGAHAALDYATRDAGIDATLLISGGRTAAGPYPPSNPLFLLAEREPARIRDAVDGLVDRLTQGRGVPQGSQGEHGNRSALRRRVIAGTGHADVVNADATAREIVEWLDASFGRQRHTPPALTDPRRRPTLLAGLALLLCLPGLSLLASRMAAGRPPPPARGALALPIFATGLLLALPVTALGTLLPFIPFEVGDALVSHLALAGTLLLVLLAATGRLDLPISASGALRALLVAAAVFLILSALLQPVALSIHGMALTPERALMLPLIGLALLPFSLSLELYLRRGAWPGAVLRCLVGRAIVVGVLLLGIWLALLPPVLGLMIGALVACFALVEVLAWGLYAESRDSLCIALIDASVLALVIAASLPIRL